MIKEVICCDNCSALDVKKSFSLDGREVCERCHIAADNQKKAINFNGCDRCKYSGIIHKSIYAVGHGYFDEPDPTIYCTCKKGTALNPNTNWEVL